MKLLVLLLVFMPAVVLADDLKGVGNDCVYDDSSGDVMMLDYLEAKVLLQMPPDFGSEQTPKEMAQYAIERLRRLDPVRADRYEPFFANFEDDARVIGNAGLRNSRDDYYYPVTPGGRPPKQLAQHVISPEPYMPRYIIEGNFWNEMDDVNKAYFMLHQGVVSEVYHRGHKTSEVARLFNGYLASGVFASMTQDEYHRLLRDIGLPAIANIGGVDVDRFSIENITTNLNKATVLGKHDDITFNVGDRFIQAWHGQPIWFDDQGEIVRAAGSVEVRDAKYHLQAGCNKEGRLVMTFHSNGDLHVKEHSACMSGLNIPVKLDNECEYNLSIVGDFVISSDNALKDVHTDRAYLQIGTDEQCLSGEARFASFVGEGIEFYRSGRIRTGRLREGVELETSTGEVKAFGSDSVLKFSENGLVIE